MGRNPAALGRARLFGMAPRSSRAALFLVVHAAHAATHRIPRRKEPGVLLYSDGRLAIFGAIAFVDLVDALARVLEREPWGRTLGHAGLVALLVAAGIFLWGRRNREYKLTHADPVMASLGQETWDVIQQFRTLNPHVRPGSKLAFLDDPFQSWDMLFLAELWFRDRSLDIHVPRHGPLTPEELAKMDYVFTFQDGKLVELK